MRDRAPRAALVAALVAGVAGQPLAASVARAQPPPSAEWRTRLLTAARAVTFGREQAPVPDASVPRGTPTTGIPGVTFAPAVGRRGAAGVAGRITSRAAYPRLGIPEGVSYLWVATRPQVRMAIVPASATRAATWLPASPHASPGSSDPCRANPFATQLGTRRPGPGTLLVLAACTCVDGVWMHTEGANAERLTEANARLLLAR